MRHLGLVMLAFLVWTGGCASSTSGDGGDLAGPGGGGGDLSVSADDLGVPDLGMPADLSASVDDMTRPPPDMTLVCADDGGAHFCDGDDGGNPPFCVGGGQCCTSAECPSVANGTPTCSASHDCGFVCDPGYKACNGACIPTTNCCGNSDCTVAGESCVSGSCQCPSGQRVCPLGNMCIPDTTCCSDSDCPDSGEKCSGFGGTCSCPSGTYDCSGNTSCIANNLCCTDADCLRIRNINGETCSGPGGTCSCPSNTKECPSGSTTPGTCVSTASGSCCPASVNTDCAAPNVCAPSCNSDTCGIPANGCCAGWVNVDGVWSNGCECQDDVFGKSCGGAVGLGNINQSSGAASKTGVLPLAGEENWFQVTFNGTRDNTYHPHVTISSVDDIRFDIFNGLNCSAPMLSCPAEGNAPASNRTNWEMFASSGDPNGIGCGSSTLPCNTVCNCTSAYNGMPAPGNSGTIYIKVHRVTGSATCHTYTLSVTD